MASSRTKKRSPRTASADDSTWRLTNQRSVILEYLRSSEGHHAAEEVLAAVKKKLPKISLATVYRNLNFLRDHGYIREIVVQKISRYEGKIDAHVHLLCQSCGSVVNVQNDGVFMELRDLAKKNKFDADVSHIELHGHCVACRQKSPAGQTSDEDRCASCGKLHSEIMKTAAECTDCRFNNSCVYYHEARAASSA